MHSILSLYAAGVIALGTTTSAFAGPAVFSDLGFEQARTSNIESGGILVVKMTAEWCGPCKMMDRTTWVDDNVIAWFDQHGTAIAVDVDEHSKVSESLSVRAMPTMIAFQAGKEIDRVVGYQAAEELLVWLNGMKDGITGEERVQSELAALKQRGEAGDMQARLDYAQQLTELGRHEESLVEFVWLWNNMLDESPSMAGVRLSFMLGSIERLISEYPQAGVRFRKIRDDLVPYTNLQNDKFDRSRFNDWLRLTEMFQEDDVVRKWFDDAIAAGIFEQTESIPAVVRGFAPRLFEYGFYKEAAQLINDPVARIERDIESLAQLRDKSGPYAEFPDEYIGTLTAYQQDDLIKEASLWAAALLMVERDEEALRISSRVTKALGNEFEVQVRRAFLNQAIELGSVRSYHERWVKEHLDGEDDQAELLKQVQGLLE